MSRLAAHKNSLYELRYSTMCKPAGEVANLTQLESHTTRARILMMWRIAAGYSSWGEREVEILYQSTLDSISEAFDVFHYPVSSFMLDARFDVWNAGLAPRCVSDAVNAEQEAQLPPAPGVKQDGSLILAGELAQFDSSAYLTTMQITRQLVEQETQIWLARTGALAYVLGAHEVARQQAQRIIAGIQASRATTIIADGPETAWALLKVYPALGLALPEGVQVMQLSDLLVRIPPGSSLPTTQVFIHDSRPAYFLGERLPSHLAILPEIMEDEAIFGQGAVYEAVRQIVDSTGSRRVTGAWTRGLAKSCGADDGLWLTYPSLAAGLARQRLEYARNLGASAVVTSSPICASFLVQHRNQTDPQVFWLPEYLLQNEAAR